MDDVDDYSRRYREHARALISKGHADDADLRELLICTTVSAVAPIVEAYFCERHRDRGLLARLVAIALEGEDAGDAPWAAANVIADYPAIALQHFRDKLTELSRENWDYLNRPAKAALAKLDAAGL